MSSQRGYCSQLWKLLLQHEAHGFWPGDLVFSLLIPSQTPVLLKRWRRKPRDAIRTWSSMVCPAHHAIFSRCVSIEDKGHSSNSNSLYLRNVYYVLSTLTDLVFKITLWDRHNYYANFIEENTEAQNIHWLYKINYRSIHLVKAWIHNHYSPHHSLMPPRHRGWVPTASSLYLKNSRERVA